MFAVLIGQGPNSVEIPALIFSSLKGGLERCEKLLGNDPKEYTEGGKTTYIWSWRRGISEEIASAVYTGYYDGCGECCSFILKEVEEGKPFVQWDLD